MGLPMEGSERTFAAVIFGVHGMDHLLKRVFPPLLPIWAVVFGFPLWQLGLLMGARTFGAAVGQAPMGVLSDRYDRRFLLPTGFGVMGLGLVVVAIVPFLGGETIGFRLAGNSFDARFAAMFVALLATGIGTSVVHPTGYPLITANVSPERKGRVLGLWGSASKFGDGAAPAIVGVALLWFTWNEILTGIGLAAVVYAVVLFVLLGGFVTRPAAGGDGPAGRDAEAAAGRDNRVFVYPIMAVAAYFVILIAAAGGVNVFLPEFITSTYGYELTVAGVALTAESTASFYYSALLVIAGVAQLGTGALVDRFAERQVIVAYVALASVGLAVLATATLSPVALFLILALLGATLWGMNPARDALVSEITPPEREGRTFGYVWTASLLATSVSPPIVGYVGDVAGLRTAFLLLAGVILLAAGPILLLESDRVYRPAAATTGGTGAD